MIAVMSLPTQTVFKHVLAQPIDRPGGVDPQVVYLRWSAPQQGERIVQVYVNGLLHEVSPWPEDRALWLLLDRRQAHRIELLAVSVNDPQGVWTPRPDCLTGWSPAVNDVAHLHMLRDHALPVDARFRVLVDGSLRDAGRVWDGDVSRAGFGAVFGEGGFGMDAAAGPGLGRGALGHGPLGSDGTPWQWRDARLAEGSHDLELQAVDARGEAITESYQQTLTIDRLPDAARQIEVADDFTFSWA